jgi:hypothetical protein
MGCIAESAPRRRRADNREEVQCGGREIASDHLRHAQVGERQVELGDVGDLRAGLLRSAGAQGAG